MLRTPFDISAEAASWVAEQVGMKDSHPKLSGTVAFLEVILRHESVDRNSGRRVELYEGEFLDVMYDYPEILTDDPYVALSINGMTVYVGDDTLEYLTGKRLIVEEIEVGWPVPSEKKRTVVRSV